MKKMSNPLKLFFAIVIVVSAILESVIVVTGNDILYLPLMWTPAVAQIAATLYGFKLSGEKHTFLDFMRAGGFRCCKFRYILLGCFLPLVYLLIPYLIYWTLYPYNFAYQGVSIILILQDVLLPAIIGIFISLLSALGEEIGWRGYMVSALFEQFGLKKALFVSSLFWCCWHLPLLMFGTYMEGTPVWYQVPAFILCIFPVGVIAGVLSIKTKSVWPAAFLHAAHNNYDQMVFDVITRGDDRMYYVSETGILTIVCAWILAAITYFWYITTASKKEQTI